MDRTLIVSLHDVHPGSLRRIREQLRTLKAWGVSKCSLLIIPDFHHRFPLSSHPDFREEVDTWVEAGHEPVLHGFYHDRKGRKDSIQDMFWTRFYTKGEAEFLDLTPEAARERIAQGREQMREAGWDPKGFIAPAWLYPRTLSPVLKDLGFEYTNNIGEIISLKGTEETIPARSLCYSTRAKWRRIASGYWNDFLFDRLLGQNIIRLSLHPYDFDFPSVRAQIGQMVILALNGGYQPQTYAEFVEQNTRS